MKKKILMSLVSLIIIAACLVPSLAWFANTLNFDNNPNGLTGSTTAAYFASGDGSSPEKAYLITSKVHLYNLAWLQYIGYFNKGPANNGRTQSYFKLGNNIDMTGITLPPIGTTQYPFLGIFDGGGYVISNLTTANISTAFSQRPTSAEFKVNSLLSTYTPSGTSAEVGHVMGLFGVIGDYDGAAAVAGQSSDETDGITVKNLGLVKYTLNSSSSASTVGIVAGYVSASIESIMVGECTLTTENATSGVMTSDAISRHTLVGYCKGSCENVVNMTEYTVTDPGITEEKDINNVSGENADWGGSIAMDMLYLNLYYVLNDYSYTTVSLPSSSTPITDAAGIAVYRLNSNNLKSGYVISSSVKASTDYDYTQVPVSELTSGGTILCYVQYYYKAYQGLYFGNSLIYPSRSGIDVTTAAYYELEAFRQAQSNAPTLMLNSEDTLEKYIQLVNENGMPLYADAAKSITTEASGNTAVCKKVTVPDYKTVEATVTVSDGKITALTPKDASIPAWALIPVLDSYSILTSVYIGTETAETVNTANYKENSSYKYLTEGTATASVYQSTASTDYVSVIYDEYTTSQDYKYLFLGGGAWDGGKLVFNNANSNDSTYIPLLVQGDYNSDSFDLKPLSNSNPGYITSGFYSDLSADGALIDNSFDGDIRISKYAVSNLNGNAGQKIIAASVKSGTLYTNELDVLSGDASAYNYKKYAESVKTYRSLIAGGAASPLYGLHFMDGLISVNSLVTIPKAQIYSSSYENYEVPADCINFNLNSRGYIDFFAGTYQDGGEVNAFFSLHRIIRSTDTPTKVSAIKEIYQIYEKENVGGYVYAYYTDTAGVYEYEQAGYDNNGNVSYTGISALPDGYNLVFDMTWLTQPDQISLDRAYYFEIPVDAGEFALGSVNGKTGAYLLYLDIGASLQDATSQNINRTITQEVFIEEAQIQTYAKGVGILLPDSSGNYTYKQLTDEQASLMLSVGYGKSLTLTLSGDKLEVSSAQTANVLLSYEGSVPIVSGNNVTLESSPGGRTVIKRVTYRDNNVDNSSIITTVITLTFTDSNSNGLLDTDEAYTVTIKDLFGNDITGTGITTVNGVTTFDLSHHATQDSISWNSITAGTAVLSYRYANESGVTVTNTPVFTLNTDNKTGSYAVTVAATAQTTVTVTEKAQGSVATEVSVLANDSNVTVYE